MLKTIETIPLDGGRLCFDFINTVHSWKTEERFDLLRDYKDFLAWCRRLSVPVPSKTARSGERTTKESTAALARTVKIRDILYKVFSAIVQNSKLDEHTEKAFSKYLSSALASIRLQFQPGSVSVVIDSEKDPFIAPLFHVLKSCYDVLTLDDLKRIKQCPNCGWTFYDSTKNNRRQWCNPLTCGSMDKSKRYYWRKKAGG
jgi:predicted RNA-binding Zn ribbon-like protein